MYNPAPYYNTQHYDPRYSQQLFQQPQYYQQTNNQQYVQQQPQYIQQPNQQQYQQQYEQPQNDYQQQDQQKYQFNQQYQQAQQYYQNQDQYAGQDQKQQKQATQFDYTQERKQYDSTYTQQQSKAITTQPKIQAKIPPAPGGSIQWMVRPNPIPGCPRGLEYLTQIDKLFIHEEPNIIQAFTGWQQANKYAIKNSAGQNVYKAYEESGTCMRLCCKQNRGFIIHIIDNMNQEVLKISRKFKCCAGCCWCVGCCTCCAFEVKVELPQNGKELGYVEQMKSCWAPLYHVIDFDDDEIMKIKGPRCIFDGPCCPCDNNFKVTSLDESKSYGTIGKHYGGFANEAWTNAQNFSIDFPINMDVEHKALLLGALFLIDFMFFETPKSPSNQTNKRY